MSTNPSEQTGHAATPAGPGRLTNLLRSTAGIAIAVAAMNIGTYAFQIVCARLLGPEQFGAVAGMLALLMVLSVGQMGLQATCARRIAADPDHVTEIEAVVLRMARRAALVLGLCAVAASPLVWKLLRLDGILPAVLLGLTVIPVTLMGAQAGVLQGERRWLPLSLVYFAVGVPRVVIGAVCLLISPTETSAMLGVLVATWVPVLVGSWALGRHPRPTDVTGSVATAEVVRETVASSVALLAFVALSNLDIVVARSVMDGHDAGLYAGGLIVTKAVLFLPQFAVVVLFPSMSTDGESRAATIKGLAFLSTLGAVCVAGTWVLSDLALVFVGGEEYAGVQDSLWLFAVLGALLALLQLLVYAGIARQGQMTKYVMAAGVVAMVGFGSLASTVTGLATTVALVDAAVLLVLVLIQLGLHRREDAAASA